MASTIPTILQALSLFGLTLGTLNLTLGTGILGSPAAFTPKTTPTALAESQIRYAGGPMTAIGALVYWISLDVAERKVPLAIIAAGVVAGGLGRAWAARKHGSGNGNMRGAMWVELVLPPLFWVYGRWAGAW